MIIRKAFLFCSVVWSPVCDSPCCQWNLLKQRHQFILTWHISHTYIFGFIRFRMSSPRSELEIKREIEWRPTNLWLSCFS